MIILIISIIGTIFIGVSIYLFLKSKKSKKQIEDFETELKKYKYYLKSAYVKFGKTFEHFAPFTKNFPGDKQTTFFLGQPIDFICFDDKSIKFIEVKTGNSMLSPKQKKIKQLIENKQVEWHEVRY